MSTDDNAEYTATLVIARHGGRVTMESGPHPSADAALAGLADLVHRLKPKARRTVARSLTGDGDDIQRYEVELP